MPLQRSTDLQRAAACFAAYGRDGDIYLAIGAGTARFERQNIRLGLDSLNPILPTRLPELI
jgi:hypothetical protein